MKGLPYFLMSLRRVGRVGIFVGATHSMITDKAEAPLTQLAQQVEEWINTTGVRYFDPLTNMAMLSEEVGEVARIMARRYGQQSEKESDKARDLGEELSDVLFVVLCLANQTGTDLQASWTERMEAKTARDKDRHVNNPKLG